jgi:hypothetical protein
MNGTWMRVGMAAALVVALATIAAAWADEPVRSGVAAGPHEAYQIVCEILEDTSWMDEGIMHIRNRKLASVVISDSIAHAGTGTIVSSADIDTVSGHLVYAGNLEIRPEALDGHWTGVFTMLVDDDGLRGQAVLHGNGPDLDGMYVVADLVPLPPAALEGFADACGGQMPIAGTRAVGAYYRLRP